MPKLTAPADVYVSGLDIDAKAGESYDIPAEHVESLTAQGWTSKPPKTAPADDPKEKP